MSIIRAEQLSRQFRDVHALKRVSFTVEEGGVVGLLGPNGAGKTTTLRILTGELAPTGGRAEVCGHDVLQDPGAIAGLIGYLPENAPLYDEMTVQGTLAFVGRLRGLGRAERARAIERTGERVGIQDRLDQPVRTLSRGFRQRVGLAVALLHEPPLLILDEPTTGLDPNQIVEIRTLIRQLAERCTVLLSSHLLPEVQNTCDRVLILHQGELVADAPVEEILTDAAHQVRLQLGPATVVLEDDAICASIAALPGVDQVTPGPDRTFLVDARDDVRPRLFHWAVDQGQVIIELSSRSASLEEAFRTLTR